MYKLQIMAQGEHGPYEYLGAHAPDGDAADYFVEAMRFAREHRGVPEDGLAMHYESELPTEEEAQAIASWAEVNACAAMSMEFVLERGDAPPLVLAFFRRAVDSLAAYVSDEECAKRPYTADPYGARYRFFDGPWFTHRNALGSFAVEEAAFLDGDGDDLVRYTATPLDTYMELARAGDIEGCRVLAAAIYEVRAMRERASRIIVQAALVCDARHKVRELELFSADPQTIEEHGARVARYLELAIDGRLP